MSLDEKLLEAGIVPFPTGLDQLRYVSGRRPEGFDRRTVWRGKNGELTQISEMSDSHLRHTLRMLGRVKWLNPESVAHACSVGQMSSVISRAWSLARPEVNVSFMALLAEWERRGNSRDSWALHA